MLDPMTVATLERHVPRHSTHECEKITRWMSEGRIFRNISNHEDRNRILSRLLASARLITLESFFQDTIWLEACHRGIIRLLSSEPKAYRRGTRAAFKEIYIHEPRQFEFNYIKLWLFGLRDFPHLSTLTSSWPRVSTRAFSDTRKWNKKDKFEDLRLYARSIGFVDQDDETFVERMCEDETSSVRAEVTTDLEDTPFNARWNRPFEQSFYVDRRHFTISEIYSEEPVVAKRFVSTFGIAQDIVKCFWGQQSPVVSSNTLESTKLQQQDQQMDVDLNRDRDQDQNQDQQMEGLAEH